MKRFFVITLALCLLAAPALAAKAPACEKLGSKRAAEHLYTHVYAFTEGWDGVGPAPCNDPVCQEEYGHVHCYGRQVRLWDTPAKGESRVAYYPFGSSDKIGPDTEFEVIDVVTYRGKYFANLRIYLDGVALTSGFVNADYIGCDCERYEAFEEVPEYEHDHGAFSLK